MKPPPAVAAGLFRYMDDEVDVWASSMRAAATVLVPSDEWHQYCGLLGKSEAHQISSQTPRSHFHPQISNKMYCFALYLSPAHPSVQLLMS